MKWFGPSWGAPINDDCGKVPTPGWKCLHCEKGFDEESQGVTMSYAGGPESLPPGTSDPAGTRVAYH
ncbi:hypothetical protein LCGC14_1819330, partial [marine sediment metagenome]